MKKATGLCFMIMGMLVLAGCATTPSVKLPVKPLSLGHETLQSLRDRLGKPSREGTVVKNGQTLKTLSYVSTEAAAQGDPGGPALHRTQTFFFHNGVLAGHVYFSTRERDRKDPDPSKVERIKENQTQIEEAVNLLGRPSGEYLYPLISAKGERAKVYEAARFLVVSYNTAGVVTKVEFAESGENQA